MLNTCPVVMYPEGVVVGKVTSGRRKPGTAVRHVAYTPERQRVGTFDTYREAANALVEHARAKVGAS